MKKNLILLTTTLVLQSFLLLGQTTITRNNFFSIGNSYPFMFLDSVRQDTASITGNNVVWDFSNVVQAAVQDTLHIIPPDTTVFFNAQNTNYNISNLCYYEPVGYFSYYDEMYSYFIDDTLNIHLVGSWAYNPIYETGLYHYTDTDRMYTFPFALNDYFTDTLIGSHFDFSGGGGHAVHGRRIVEADGFGTLIMPNMIYPNCLRIKSTRHMTDSAMFTFYAWTDTAYTWFQLNTNGYIFKIENELGIRTNKYYYSNPLISSLSENNFDNRLTLFPNPCESNLSFKWNEKFAGNANVSIRNVLGQIVWYKEIASPSTLDYRNIDVGLLLRGWYTLEVRTSEMTRIGKFIKE